MPKITTKTVGAGGSWKVIGERSDPGVVKQLTPHSCVAAIGEMLLRSRGISVSQQKIIDIIGELSTPELLAEFINEVDSDRWYGGFIDPDKPDRLVGLSEFGVVFREGHPLGHMVLVTLFTEGFVYVNDPWEGTSYRMSRTEFGEVWDGGVVMIWRS